MKIFNRLFALTILTILTFTLASCGNSSSGGSGSGPVSGMAIKGPFVADSTVTAYVLSPQTSIRNTATAKITKTDAAGGFTFANINGPTELEIYGFYLDELTNATSTARATLTAIINTGGEANINVFTDIEASLIKALTKNPEVEISAAKQQATASVIEFFNLAPATVLTELDPTDIFSADENQENNRKLLVASAAVASTPTILMALQDENNQNENEIKRILDTVNVAIVALNAADLGNIVNNIAADLNGGTATGTSTITTEQISDAKEVNSPPTGVLEITGVAVIGQTLRVDAAVINDADGTGTFTYQWLANNQEIAAATTSSLTLSTSNTKIGDIITVIVSYTDGATPPTAESVESLSAEVAPVVIAITSIPSVIKGETLTLTASQTPAGQTIAWTIQGGSSNIASIAADGETIHGVAIGSVVIVATAQDGTSVTQQFTVSAARATGITVPSTIANSSVFDNSSINLMANVLPPAADQSVSWSISAGTQFASLSGNRLSGTAPGTVTLVVSVDSSPTLTANHTVTVKKVAITGISITSADTVDHRGTLELTVRVEPAGATNPAVTWSRISGSSQIASINGSTLTGVRPGSIRIRATAVDDSSITAEQDIRVVGIPVTSVEITTTGPFVDGDTTEFAATVLPNNASTPGLTWSITSGGANANFSVRNLFNALAPGRVTVRATAHSGVSDTQEITISQIDVTAVSITSAATAFINTNLNLTHTTTPSVVSDSSVSWEIVSAGSTGATITGNTFRATAAGTAQIRATSVSNSNISATQDIIINDIPVTSISITSANQTPRSSTFQLTADVEPPEAAASIVWSVEGGNNSIGSINGSTLHALSHGNIIILASGVGANGAITVEQNFFIMKVFVSEINITSANSAAVGETIDLTATVLPDNASTPGLTWTILSGGTNASINGTVLTGVAIGEATVSAQATDGSGNAGVQVVTVRAAAVTGISIENTVTRVQVGRDLTLTATVTPSGAAQNVIWSVVADGGSATITNSILSGVTAGNVIVTASASDSSGVSSGPLTFTVTPLEVSSISITSAATVVNGQTLSLEATVLPDAASNKNINWSITAGSEFASLNGTTLTSTGVGTVTITATAADGSGTTASQDISVLPILVSGITITSRASVINGSTQNLVATVLPADAADRTVSWSITTGSGNATLAGNVLTGTGVGTVTITATANDGSGTTAEQLFTIVVTPVAPATLQAVATGTANQIIVFWSASAGATGYKLSQSSTGKTGTFSVIRTITDNTLRHNLTLTNANTDADKMAYFKVRATYGASEETAESDPAGAKQGNFVFKTVNGNGNTVWMDRNLDASQVATALNDAESYGGYYQFGRPADGHQSPSSDITATPSTTRFPEHGDYIWAQNQDNWLTGGGINYEDLKAFYQKTDGSSVCPTGFRGALAAEWTTESNSWTSFSANEINAAHTAFASNLKLPAGGYRNAHNTNAELVEVGEVGQYIIPLTEQTFGFGGSVGLGSSGPYAHGRTVRCIRDADLTVLPLTDFVKITAIADSTDTLADGGTLELTVATTPANATNKTIIWSITSGGNFATLFNNTLTATAPGTVVLSGLSNDGSNITTAKTVTVTSVAVTSVEISTIPSINVGATVTLAATVLPTNASNPALTWAITAGSQFASINGNTLTGTAVGEVTVQATADGVNSTQDLNITAILVSGITINAPDIIGFGQTADLSADITPANASDTSVTWSIVSGGSLASLSGNQLTTGNTLGTVQVRATANDTGGVTAERDIQIAGLAVPATLQAVANGTQNQATVFWSAVADASGYKLYQSADDLSAFAGGTPPTAATIIETTELGTNLNLEGTDKNYFLVTAIINGAESTTNPAQAIAVANSQVFETVTGENNRVWMDRNLGAAQVATATDDADAYGDYYQWGRPKDGHQLEGSTKITNLADSITPNHADFILPSAAPFDWAVAGVDTDGSARSAIWGSTNGSGICPTGFRVPTGDELEAERVSWTSNDNAGAFASILKLPISGYYDSGLNRLFRVGSIGRYWGSTINGSNSNYLTTAAGGASTKFVNRGSGHSVRCIRDASITTVPVI